MPMTRCPEHELQFAGHFCSHLRDAVRTSSPSTASIVRGELSWHLVCPRCLSADAIEAAGHLVCEACVSHWAAATGNEAFRTWCAVERDGPEEAGPFHPGPCERGVSMDRWTTDGARFDELLPTLRHVIEHESDVIVEHRFYRGARAPFRFVSRDYEQLAAYVREHARPGDAFCVWRVEEVLRDDNLALYAKMPDSQGRTREGGAY